MKGRRSFALLLLASLVIAASYLAGALAPPLRGAAAAEPGRPALASAAVPLSAYEALQNATELLLSGDDADGLYMPMIRR